MKKQIESCGMIISNKLFLFGSTDGPQSVILDPPKSSFTLPSGTLMPSVTCSANCNPECSYKWVKDDSATPLTTSRALNIGQVDQGQAGIYKCISENEFGNASSKFVLSVQCE